MPDTDWRLISWLDTEEFQGLSTSTPCLLEGNVARGMSRRVFVPEVHSSFTHACVLPTQKKPFHERLGSTVHLDGMQLLLSEHVEFAFRSHRRKRDIRLQPTGLSTVSSRSRRNTGAALSSETHTPECAVFHAPPRFSRGTITESKIFRSSTLQIRVDRP